MKNAILILGIIAFVSIFFSLNSKKAVKWTVTLFVLLLAMLAINSIYPEMFG